MTTKTALVCGAGGFIGSHLVKRLKREGFWVRGVDLKYPEFAADAGRRLRRRRPARPARSAARSSTAASTRSTSSPPTWAAPATSSPASTTPTSCTTRRRSTSTCSTRAASGTSRGVFYSSSACMYPALQPGGSRQPELRRGQRPIRRRRTASTAGRSCSASASTSPTTATTAWRCRVARYHNIFGPEGTWDGGQEKAPAAICRKVAEARRRRRDRDLGRRRADALVPLHRRMPRRHAAPDALGLRRARSTSAPRRW